MKSIFLKTAFFSLLCFTSLHAENAAAKPHVYVEDREINTALGVSERARFTGLTELLYGESTKNDQLKIVHLLASIEGEVATLTDGSQWQIGWWYTGVIKDWKPGDRLRITQYPKGYLNNIKIQNLDSFGVAWATLSVVPNPEFTETIARISAVRVGAEKLAKIVLNSGKAFTAQPKEIFHKNGWKAGDRVFVFHDKDKYSLLNFEQGKGIYQLNLNQSFNQILELEENLNQNVLYQEDATKIVAETILNHYAGMKNPHAPVGVFLFLGPTGVGKTEVARVLVDELYKDPSRLVRFDMTQFNADCSFERPIASEPCLQDNEQEKYLAEEIQEKQRCVVLLENIESANCEIHKMFFPVFDEGKLVDAKGNKIPCNEVIFILKSKLFADEIQRLSREGVNSRDILAILEPYLIESLSPELYSRVQPVIFTPLEADAMPAMVKLHLEKLHSHFKKVKGVDVQFDKSVHQYLIRDGYHPALGGHPLKRLIETKVVACLSYAILRNEIKAGDQVTMFYDPVSDIWRLKFRV